MPRKQTKPKGVINPLERMFGFYLRLQRCKLGYTSKDVGDRLGLSDTYLRLVEAGNSSLNQSLSFKLIEVLAGAERIAPTRTISFSRLALFLACSHWIGAEMATMLNEPTASRRAAETLAAHDSSFEIFFKRVEAYFDLEEGSKEQKGFLETVVVPELELFLTCDTYGRFDIDAMRRDILTLPSLNVEILMRMKASMAHLQFIRMGQDTSRWEKQNSSKFSAFRGIFRRNSLIESLRGFSYGFLKNPRFTEMNVILLDAEEEPGLLMSHFSKLLPESRKIYHHALQPEVLEGEKSKVHFLCPHAEEQQRFESQLNELFRESINSNNDPQEYDAYLSFETHEGLSYDFLLQDGVVCNMCVGDSMRNAPIFKRIWADLTRVPISA